MTVNQNHFSSSTSSPSSSSAFPSTTEATTPPSHATRVEDVSTSVFEQDAHLVPAKREADLRDRVSSDTIDYSEMNKKFIADFPELLKGPGGRAILRALKEREENQRKLNQLAALTTTQPPGGASIN